MKRRLDPAPGLDNSLLRGVMKVLIEQGAIGFMPVFEPLMNEAMIIERPEPLQKI